MGLRYVQMLVIAILDLSNNDFYSIEYVTRTLKQARALICVFLWRVSFFARLSLVYTRNPHVRRTLCRIKLDSAELTTMSMCITLLFADRFFLSFFHFTRSPSSQNQIQTQTFLFSSTTPFEFVSIHINYCSCLHDECAIHNRTCIFD